MIFKDMMNRTLQVKQINISKIYNAKKNACEAT